MAALSTAVAVRSIARRLAGLQRVLATADEMPELASHPSRLVRRSGAEVQPPRAVEADLCPISLTATLFADIEVLTRASVHARRAWRLTVSSGRWYSSRPTTVL